VSVDALMPRRRCRRVPAARVDGVPLVDGASPPRAVLEALALGRPSAAPCGHELCARRAGERATTLRRTLEESMDW